MRNRMNIIKWPLRNLPARHFSTTARCGQAAEPGIDIGSNKVGLGCPIHGHRARSTHAAIDTSVFENVAPSVKSWEEVPGPKPLPLLGNTWRFIPYIGGYSVEHVDKVCLSLREQYGNCVKMAGLLGRPDMLFVFDAWEVERVFRGEDVAPHRPSMPSLNYYKHTLRRDFFGAEDNCAGVIAVHGEAWSAFRTKVSKVALSAGAAAEYTVPVAQVADAFVNRIRKIRNEKQETPDDFLNEVHKWSLESLGLVALDTRLGCFEASEGSESQRLIDAVNTFFLCVGELELRAPWWRIYPTAMFKRYVAALDTILSVTLNHVERALEETRKANSSKSLLQDLVAAAGARVAAVAALDMFLVGIDTTSNAVASTLYQLSLRPNVQEKLYKEITGVLQGRPMKPGDVNQMPYLRACIKEVLRMYPVVIGNGRQLTKDTVICGYNIPKGTQVIFQHYVMGNTEEYFTKASEFCPERWIQRTAGQNHHPFASLPFGFGKRMCLGRRFAELEIHTVICKMVQAFKMEYHHQPLEYHVHPMYTPNGPIRLKLIER
ncbi:probable cytochrome P450 49a1 [Galleria mellonella]|uniref:Probable cytochrome P450 49a1 n=1 Tax=Galleria mellonella TaxID=7137 RepID=A0ABM3ME19_GALME|nr:probable cytochrome P450 49a1 [Galleria mellonella]XP_052749658.1 probable cytochrome P450 49a1 [Galleria mellonella]XP_052749659.1 probable cytochrome P450 49a1 [Galleria mellonella]XP_052749660.1 probable cytochrome P450 49a1 [Galleria mellonella]XP_052749661.1 probable cytochrome P450 49a1 [Galleria mellonella]